MGTIFFNPSAPHHGVPSKGVCVLWSSDLEKSCTNSDSNPALHTQKSLATEWNTHSDLTNINIAAEHFHCKWKSKVCKNWGLGGKESWSCFRNVNNYLVSLSIYSIALCKEVGVLPPFAKSRKFNGMNISIAILRKYKCIGCRSAHLFQRLSNVKLDV